MGRPNWCRCLAYSTARSVVHAAEPTWSAAVSTAPSRRHQAAMSGPPTGVPGGRRGTDHTGVSGSIGRDSLTASSSCGSTAATPTSDRTNRTSRSPSHSTISGATSPVPGAPISTRPTTTDPSSAPSIRPAARCEATRGPGTRARPSSSKTSAASARPSPTPPASSARHRLKTPASPRERHPFRSTTCSASSKARSCSRANWPWHIRRTPSARSVWNSVSSKSIRGPYDPVGPEGPPTEAGA